MLMNSSYTHAADAFVDALTAYNQKNFARALSLFSDAAKDGDGGAINNKGVILFNGEGIARNEIQAVSEFKIAADQGLASAQFNLGLAYESGRGLQKDLKKAMEAYSKAAKQGLAQAQFNLGVMLLTALRGETPKGDPSEAVALLKSAADQGFDPAQNALGMIAQAGIVPPKDFKAAAKWYEKAVKKDNLLAKMNLGFLYAEGLGLQKNSEKAFQIYMAAVQEFEKHGQIEGRLWDQNLGAELMYRCGWMHESGLGTVKDSEAAKAWYEKAANLGHSNAMVNLGVRYTEENFLDSANPLHEKAVEWFRKAAETGNPEAMLRLGFMYDAGRGVTRNHEEAKVWYQKASALGNAQAESALGSH